jgi:hypothetical protein
MNALITDEMVDAFTVSGRPEEIGPIMQKRFGDIIQRTSFDSSVRLTPERTAAVLAAFH